MAYHCILALMLTSSSESPHELSHVVYPCETVPSTDIKKHDLLLYYTTYCPYSQRVLKYLKKIHKRLPMKNLADDALAKEELKKVGGKMQVPCLVIDGKALYESNEIIHWLSEHQNELPKYNNI